MLPTGSSLPILSLLPANVLPKRARMVTYCFSRFGNPDGWLSISRLCSIWPVHLAHETLRGGGLAWFWVMDTVCCSPA